MSTIQWGSLVLAALAGSTAILVSMYLLLPAMGLPKLDFAAITGGWVGATGRYAKVVGVLVFAVGGLAWAFLYARFWPWHSVLGGIGFAMIPFAVSMASVLPELARFHVMIQPMPGFVLIKVGGPSSVAANLVEHIIFGLCLGMFY